MRTIGLDIASCYIRVGGQSQILQVGVVGTDDAGPTYAHLVQCPRETVAGQDGGTPLLELAQSKWARTSVPLKQRLGKQCGHLLDVSFCLRWGDAAILLEHLSKVTLKGHLVQPP